jgi:hypothetical protein
MSGRLMRLRSGYEHGQESQLVGLSRGAFHAWWVLHDYVCTTMSLIIWTSVTPSFWNSVKFQFCIKSHAVSSTSKSITKTLNILAHMEYVGFSELWTLHVVCVVIFAVWFIRPACTLSKEWKKRDSASVCPLCRVFFGYCANLQIELLISSQIGSSVWSLMIVITHMPLARMRGLMEPGVRKTITNLGWFKINHTGLCIPWK